MIKKDLKLYVNVGENSLALRKLMAEHLESMGIDGDLLRNYAMNWLSVTFNNGEFSLSDRSFFDDYKEITVAEFFNLTEADLKEPVRSHCEFNVKQNRRFIAYLSQEQINRVLAIFDEGES